jgi:hypothetical protein
VHKLVYVYWRVIHREQKPVTLESWEQFFQEFADEADEPD